MSNSWNNSTRGEFYSKSYAKELQEIKSYVSQHLLGGLKFMTWEDIEFLLKLKWHEDSVRFLVRENFYPSLSFYVFAGHVTINCHTDEEIPGERFFNITFEACVPPSLQEYKKFYEVADFVRYLEIEGQLALGFSVEASSDPKDLGYVPNIQEDRWRTYTPITWEAIERLPLEEREKQLADTYLKGGSSLCYRFDKSWDEVNVLLYGTSDPSTIAAIRKARTGEPKAAVALGLGY